MERKEIWQYLLGLVPDPAHLPNIKSVSLIRDGETRDGLRWTNTWWPLVAILYFERHESKAIILKNIIQVISHQKCIENIKTDMKWMVALITCICAFKTRP